MLIDSHCHLYLRDDPKEIPAVLERSRAAGVSAWLCPAIDLASARTCTDLARTHDFLYAAAGIHPNYTAEASEGWQDELVNFLKLSEVVAVGEIGLDYYREHSPFDTQRSFFREQLALAGDADLPVIVHNRNADEDTATLIKDSGVRHGVAHCFSSEWAAARKFLDLGFYISFAGNLTFKNSPLPEVAARVPLDRTLVETDSPFLSPAPFRGRPNEPARTRQVAEKLAEIHGVPLATVVEQTRRNTVDLFRLPLS
ncbi:MAG: TatD family hydrolase [FCB group bacterium]|nr:TatD family hydrolase [FCB group bacterium]